MLVREFTFGGTPCLIQVRMMRRPGSVPPSYEAALYVLEDGGRRIRRVGDRDGRPVKVSSGGEHGTLASAVFYLQKRFGRQGTAPASLAGDGRIRPIDEPPLTDERPTR